MGLLYSDRSGYRTDILSKAAIWIPHTRMISIKNVGERSGFVWVRSGAINFLGSPKAITGESFGAVTSFQMIPWNEMLDNIVT